MAQRRKDQGSKQGGVLRQAPVFEQNDMFLNGFEKSLYLTP
jgi:hypothetical protein